MIEESIRVLKLKYITEENCYGDYLSLSFVPNAHSTTEEESVHKSIIMIINKHRLVFPQWCGQQLEGHQSMNSPCSERYFSLAFPTSFQLVLQNFLDSVIILLLLDITDDGHFAKHACFFFLHWTLRWDWRAMLSKILVMYICLWMSFVTRLEEKESNCVLDFVLIYMAPSTIGISKEAT